MSRKIKQVKYKKKASDGGPSVELKLRLAEETLSAIRTGSVDAVIVESGGGERVFTLAGAENSYRLFVEAMNEGAATISGDDTILYCNRGFADLLRAPLEQLIGSNAKEHLPAPEHHIYEALMREASGGGSKVESTLQALDGTLVPVYLSAKSFKEFGWDAICLLATDLTEQKRNDQILAEGKLAKLILEQAAEAIAVCDGEGRVVQCNLALAELYGQNPLFKSFDEVFEVEFQGRSEENGPEEKRFAVADVVRGNTVRGREVRIERSNGERVHMLLSAAPVQLPSGNGGCVITLFDIEERKRAEATLRKSEKLAATGQLAATIAHEINNPLEGVTNLLYLLEHHAGLDATAAQFVKMAQQELARVVHITKQTLAFHRESRVPIPVSLTDLVESVTYLYSRQVAEKQVTVLPDIRFAGKVLGFENELRQVVSNLFNNALDACQEGGRITVRVRPAREWGPARRSGVRIVIADNGKGIPCADRPKIFSPFFTTKGERGTGLGLWVTEGVVNKHHGLIAMRSSTAPGRRGTVFSVFLPLKGEARKSSAVA